MKKISCFILILLCILSCAKKKPNSDQAVLQQWCEVASAPIVCPATGDVLVLPLPLRTWNVDTTYTWLHITKDSLVSRCVHLRIEPNEGFNTDTAHVVFTGDGYRLPLTIIRLAQANGQNSIQDVCFQVAESKFVQFASGNLQENIKTGEYRFADYHCKLDLINKNKNEWKSFFAWDKQVYQVQGEEWTMLTSTEWEYLLEKRPMARSLICVASIDSIGGIILLPDNWHSSKDVKLQYGYAEESGDLGYMAQNRLTAAQWEKLTCLGAVFFPSMGYQYVGKWREANTQGYYWTSTSKNEVQADCVLFTSNSKPFLLRDGKHKELAVRLAKILK